MGKVLIIISNPGEEVLSCGGAIQRLRKQGYEVYLLCLSPGDVSNAEEKEVATAFHRSCDFLNLMDFHMLELTSHELRTLPIDVLGEDYIKPFIDIIKPDMIFTHSKASLLKEQSRLEAAVELVAINCNMIFTFVSPEDSFKIGEEWKPNTYMTLSDKHIENKCKAFSKYSDRLDGGIRSRRGIEVSAAFGGCVIGKEYAEAFFLKKMLL